MNCPDSGSAILLENPVVQVLPKARGHWLAFHEVEGARAVVEPLRAKKEEGVCMEDVIGCPKVRTEIGAIKMRLEN